MKRNLSGLFAAGLEADTVRDEHPDKTLAAPAASAPATNSRLVCWLIDDSFALFASSLPVLSDGTTRTVYHNVRQDAAEQPSAEPRRLMLGSSNPSGGLQAPARAVPRPERSSGNLEADDSGDDQRGGDEA